MRMKKRDKQTWSGGQLFRTTQITQVSTSQSYPNSPSQVRETNSQQPAQEQPRRPGLPDDVRLGPTVQDFTSVLDHSAVRRSARLRDTMNKGNKSATTKQREGHGRN